MQSRFILVPALHRRFEQEEEDAEARGIIKEIYTFIFSLSSILFLSQRSCYAGALLLLLRNRQEESREVTGEECESRIMEGGG